MNKNALHKKNARGFFVREGAAARRGFRARLLPRVASFALKRLLPALAALLFLAPFFSCAQRPGADGIAFRLKNGVPVYYKSVDSTKMASVIICVKGGSLLFGRDYSGIEARLFDMMERGSARYSYDDLQRLSYDKHISITSDSGYAGSAFELSCISSYLNQGLDALLDCFLNPAFDQTQFDNMMTECEQSLQRTQNDPESFFFYQINKAVYKNHPLGTSPSVLPESIQNITMENLKAHYKKILDPNRICVVAAGDVNLRFLNRSLEKTLGRVPAKEGEFSLPEIPALDLSALEGSQRSFKSPGLPKESGHIAIVFKSPPLYSGDLIAARIAALMFGESLFNIVRTKYGVCYTPSTSVGFSPAPVGGIFLYRVSDMQNAASYIPEAEADFLNGDIEGRLGGFVKKYICSAYQNQMSCAAIAGRAADALLSFGDIEGFDALAESAKKLSAGDIRRVFAEYWQSPRAARFDISGE